MTARSERSGLRPWRYAVVPRNPSRPSSPREEQTVDMTVETGSEPTRRLVVVSNRVPLPTKEGASGAGGLAVALEGALKREGGLWFGWSGKTVDRPSTLLHVHQHGNIAFAVMDVVRRDFDLYYAGFAN